MPLSSFLFGLTTPFLLYFHPVRFSHSQLYIDASTIDPETARKVQKVFRDKGILMIDAPVSGGINGALNATLTFMVGGDNDAFQRSQEVLKLMGKNIVCDCD